MLQSWKHLYMMVFGNERLVLIVPDILWHHWASFKAFGNLLANVCNVDCIARTMH